MIDSNGQESAMRFWQILGLLLLGVLLVG